LNNWWLRFRAHDSGFTTGFWNLCHCETFTSDTGSGLRFDFDSSDVEEICRKLNSLSFIEKKINICNRADNLFDLLAGGDYFLLFKIIPTKRFDCQSLVNFAQPFFIDCSLVDDDDDNMRYSFIGSVQKEKFKEIENWTSKTVHPVRSKIIESIYLTLPDLYKQLSEKKIVLPSYDESHVIKYDKRLSERDEFTKFSLVDSGLNKGKK